MNKLIQLSIAERKKIRMLRRAQERRRKDRVRHSDAESALRKLHEALDTIDNLPIETARMFEDLLKLVHGHAMHGEPEDGPLGLDWCLRFDAVCETLFEQMTGSPIDSSANAD